MTSVHYSDDPTPINREETDRLEIRAQWLRVFGELVVETPVNVQHITCFGRCSIGAFSYTNHDCEIWNTDIGRFCSIGQGAIINPGNHPTGFLTSHPIATSQDGHPAGLYGFASYAGFALTGAIHPVDPTERTNRVSIGHDVWIGAQAIITTDVVVGDGAVIGAGAVVTKDVAAFSIVAGVPARPIRARFQPGLQARIQASRWWDYDLSSLAFRDYSQVERMLDLIEAGQADGSLQPYRPRRWRLEA